MSNFLLGFGIGVTIGVLFAPKSGADTRKYIADRATEGGDFLAQQGQQIKDTASDLIDRGRKVVMSSKEKVADTVSGFAREAQEQSRP